MRKIFGTVAAFWVFVALTADARAQCLSSGVSYPCPSGSTPPIHTTVDQTLTIDIITTFNAPATSITSILLFMPSDASAPIFNQTSSSSVGDQFFIVGYFSTAGFTIWQGTVFDNLGGSGLIDPFGGASTILVTVDPLVAAVPEASTWAMLLIGFVGIGLAAYRRSKIASVA
jgi:hypothetical protein